MSTTIKLTRRGVMGLGAFALARQQGPSSAVLTDRDATVTEKLAAHQTADDSGATSGKRNPGANNELVGTRGETREMKIDARFQMLRTTGFAAVGDGGAAHYARMSKTDIDEAGYPQLAYFRSADRYLPSGATASVNGGYWVVQPGSNGYNVMAFGAVQDGLTDNAAALRAAGEMARIAGQPLFAPQGRSYLRIGSAVDLTRIRNINIAAYIRVDPGIVGIPIEVGGYANSGLVCDLRFAEVTDGTSEFAAPPSRPIIRFIGVKGSDIRVGTCNYVQLYADQTRGSDFGSTAYNRLFLDGSIGLLEITDSGTTKNGGSWVNENRAYGSRVGRLRIVGVGYQHNHNRFYELNLEGNHAEITFKNCNSNVLQGLRGEDLPNGRLSFDAKTFSNRVVLSWSGSGSPQDDFRVPFTYIDSGLGNLVTTEAATIFEKVPLFSVSPASNILSTETETTADDPAIAPDPYGTLLPAGRAVLDPGLIDFGFNGFAMIVSTRRTPVVKGQVFGFDLDYGGALMRPLVTVYGADGKPLGAEGAGGKYVDFLNQSAFDVIHASYSTGANLTAAILSNSPITILRSDVAAVRIALYSGAPGRARRLSAHTFVNKLHSGGTANAIISVPLVPSLSGTPTRGFVAKRSVLRDREVSALRENDLEYETQVSGALSAGATSVTVSVIGLVRNGDVVGIVMDNGAVHWSMVSGLSGSTFTIRPVPRGRSVLASARVVFNRWT